MRARARTPDKEVEQIRELVEIVLKNIRFAVT